MPSVFPLLVFIGVIYLIIAQPKIKIPGTSKFIQLDFGFAPLIGVLILLVTLQAPISSLTVGIIGREMIKPYTIIILFFSLAYVCISIDLTGFFAYLSLTAAKKSGSSGKKLFFAFCMLSGVLTTFTSNDIVILTLTPIIVYFCKYTKVNPVPYLIGQFFMANIWSIALYVGNPTNIIVAQAYNLTFLGYSKWMILPTVVAGVSCFLMLLIVFNKELPNNLMPPQIDPKSAIKDLPGAKFGLSMLGSCLVLLSLAPILNLDMGLICFIFALLLFGKDVTFDYRQRALHEKEDGAILPLKLITSKETFSRMPWKIMPFVFGMFVLVDILLQSGWMDLFASSIGSIQSSIGLIPAVFFMTFLSTIACNFMNNQPMTILFTQILQSSSFVASPAIIQGSMYGLIMGSNFGANFTLIGALAGIMWSNISKEKGIAISYKQFAKYGFIIMPVVVGLASLVLALELTFWV